jgi:hypothetical protein
VLETKTKEKIKKKSVLKTKKKENKEIKKFNAEDKEKGK